MAETDPSAETLFGHPPRKPSLCEGCGCKVELFKSRYCWMCWTAGVPIGKRRVPVKLINTYDSRVDRKKRKVD